MSGNSYQDLVVWQKAMNLVVACYQATEQFPKKELYGLASQLQRAAVSVPANIAEGQARQYRGEFLQFLAIASGSLAELETHIMIAVRLNYIDKASCDHLLSQTSEVGKMLEGLRTALQKRSPTGN